MPYVRSLEDAVFVVRHLTAIDSGRYCVEEEVMGLDGPYWNIKTLNENDDEWADLFIAGMYAERDRAEKARETNDG